MGTQMSDGLGGLNSGQFNVPLAGPSGLLDIYKGGNVGDAVTSMLDPAGIFGSGSPLLGGPDNNNYIQGYANGSGYNGGNVADASHIPNGYHMDSFGNLVKDPTPSAAPYSTWQQAQAAPTAQVNAGANFNPFLDPGMAGGPAANGPKPNTGGWNGGQGWNSGIDANRPLQAPDPTHTSATTQVGQYTGVDNNGTGYLAHTRAGLGFESKVPGASQWTTDPYVGHPNGNGGFTTPTSQGGGGWTFQNGQWQR